MTTSQPSSRAVEATSAPMSPRSDDEDPGARRQCDPEPIGVVGGAQRSVSRGCRRRRPAAEQPCHR
jgi:hypothetical protein